MFHRTMSTTAALGLCPSPTCFDQHEQLLAEYQQVLIEYHQMQAAQLAAVKNGEDFPFEDWIAKAAVRMIQAQCALRTYRKANG